MQAAVDVGGTFTDFVISDGERVRATKLPSSPDAPEEVVSNGLRGLKLEVVGHGTTVATNAVVEGRGAATALVTTAGFEDILIIGRQRRPKLYDLRATKPDPLVPRRATLGVQERVGPDGTVLRSLTDEEVSSLVRSLKTLGVDSVAVSLLFSFLKPEHERRLGQVLSEHFHVSLSSEVLPVFREYERTSTTVLDAYVAPLVRGYVDRLRSALGSQLLVMRSNGGLREAESLRRRPVEMLLSGPAGGVAGAIYLSSILGVGEVMTLDMGGTSTDVSLLQDGEPTWTTEANIGGHPLALPVLDISTIGAGGGSVAWVDSGGALRVGPRSAGAVPGPMCYALGGEEPTLTDVDLLSGRLGDSLLAGKMPLRRDLSEAGLQGLAARLNMAMEEVLDGARRVVVSNMSRAAGLAFARRGLDPRDFILMAFGGAGPVHAAEVARDLGIREVVISPLPGAFSAYGILVADLRLDYARSIMRPLEACGDGLREAWDALEELCRAELAEQGLSIQEATLVRSLDLRYMGQSYEINVPLVEDVEGEFHRLHEARYGYAIPGEPLEVVNARLAAVVRRPKPLPQPDTARDRRADRRLLLTTDGWMEAQVLWRGSLSDDFEAWGPLVIEEQTATTVVGPDDRVWKDEVGCLRIEVG